MPILGHAGVGIDIVAAVYKVAVVVSAWRERANIIIGANFLSPHNCELPLWQRLFTTGKHEVQYIPEGVRASYTKLKSK